jgi:hypothetical protein
VWDTLPPTGPPAPPLEPPRRRGRPLALVAAVVAGTLAFAALADGRDRTDAAAPAPGTVVDGSYAFMRTNEDGSPVSYGTCGPLRFVIDPTGSPEGGTDAILRGFERMSRATGVELVYEGETSERPFREGRDVRQPRYGRGYAPILVAWSSPEEVPGLEGDVIGLGGSTALGRTSSGSWRYVTGEIALDGPQSAELVARRPRTGMASVESVVMHELGHVLGLAHVEDTSQLMSSGGESEVLGDGDVAGLHAMYGGCLDREPADATTDGS